MKWIRDLEKKIIQFNIEGIGSEWRTEVCKERIFSFCYLLVCVCVKQREREREGKKKSFQWKMLSVFCK